MRNPLDRAPEPEIIPPGAPLPNSGVWIASGGRRVYARRIGPLGIIVLALTAGVVGAIGLVVLLGVALIGLLAGGLIAAALVFAGILRKAKQPLR